MAGLLSSVSVNPRPILPCVTVHENSVAVIFGRSCSAFGIASFLVHAPLISRDGWRRVRDGSRWQPSRCRNKTDDQQQRNCNYHSAANGQGPNPISAGSFGQPWNRPRHNDRALTFEHGMSPRLIATKTDSAKSLKSSMYTESRLTSFQKCSLFQQRAA